MQVNAAFVPPRTTNFKPLTFVKSTPGHAAHLQQEQQQPHSVTQHQQQQPASGLPAIPTVSRRSSSKGQRPRFSIGAAAPSALAGGTAAADMIQLLSKKVSASAPPAEERPSNGAAHLSVNHKKGRSAFKSPWQSLASMPTAAGLRPAVSPEAKAAAGQSKSATVQRASSRDVGLPKAASPAVSNTFGLARRSAGQQLGPHQTPGFGDGGPVAAVQDTSQQ
jgi:hypothetical protein